MDVVKRKTNAPKTQALADRIAIAAHLAHVKRSGLAEHIGGFTEWAASIGYSRQQADRLVQFYEKITGGVRV